MTTPTQELCERLQEYADEDLDLGWKTNRAKAHLDAKAMIESQAAHIAELQAQITSANEAWMELYGALTKRYEELEAQLAEAKQGEPFGWMTDKRAFTKSRQIADQWRKSGYEITELFDHPPAAAASEMTPDQREAIEWAAGEAYSHAKIASGGTLMYRRWVLLTDMFRAALTAKEKGE